MILRTTIGGAVIAACAACSSNKPAEEPAHYAETAQTEVTAPEAPTSAGSEMERPNTSDQGATMGEPERSSTEERARGAGEPQGRAAVPPPPQATTPEPPAQTAPQTAPDNTRVNERDRSATVTPMNQGNNETDLKTTQRIRQAVMADDSLSFSAKNVKIVTSNGKVTLRGVVESEDERKAIDDQARRVAGDANVDDRIEVKR